MKNNSESGGLDQESLWDARLGTLLDSAGLSKYKDEFIMLSAELKGREAVRRRLINLKLDRVLNVENYKKLENLFKRYPRLDDEGQLEIQSKVELHGAVDPVWKGEVKPELDVLTGQVDAETLHKELEDELHGSGNSDVLVAEPINPPKSGIHDLSEVKTPKPTEILPTDESTIAAESIREIKKESFKLPHGASDYINKLKGQGVPWFKFDINDSHSAEAALGAIARAVHSRTITPDDAAIIKSYLPKPEVADITPKEVKKAEPEKPKEKDEEAGTPDWRFDELAAKAFDRDEPEECLEYLRSIKDPATQSISIENLVADSIDKKRNFALAKAIAETAKDPDYKVRILTRISESLARSLTGGTAHVANVVEKVPEIKPETKLESRTETIEVTEKNPVLDAIKKSNKVLVAFAVNEYKEGRPDKFWENVDKIDDELWHTRAVMAVIKNTLGYRDGYRDYDNAFDLASKIRNEEYREKLRASIIEIKKSNPAKDIEVADMLPVFSKENVQAIAATPTADAVADIVPEVEEKVENLAILNAFNSSSKDLITLLENEYIKKGKKIKDFLRDVDSIKDDTIHKKILTFLIQERSLESDFDNALKITENLRDEKYKETVKKLIEDMKTGRSSISPTNSLDTVPDSVSDPVAAVATPEPEPTSSGIVDPVVWIPPVIPDPAGATVITSVPPTMPAPPTTMADAADILSATPDSEQIINSQLEAARSEYAAQLTIWKNEARSKKGKFKKMMVDLGVTRSMPDTPKPQVLVDAENLYIAAKKKKREGLFAQKEALIADIEQEREAMLRKMSEGEPPLEKGLLRKGMDAWAKMSPAKRIALSSVLLGLGSYALGATLGVAAIAAGTRAVKAGAAVFVGQVAGKSFDLMAKGRNEKLKHTTLENYTASINETNFEQKERDLMESMERMDTREKRQRLGKAMAMMVGGGAMTLASYVPDGVPTTTTSGGQENIDVSSADSLKPKLDVAPESKEALQINPEIEQGGKIAPELEKATEIAPEVNEDVKVAPAVEGNITPLKVGLDPKGFIQDIHNLKAKVLEQYGTMDKVPPSLKENLMDKPSLSLAKQFGFYDAEKGLSGVGQKGEFLGIDSKGNIVYEHTGKTDVIFNAETEKITEFDGKKSAPKTEAVAEEKFDLRDNTNETFKEGVEFKTKPEISFEDRVRENMPEVKFAQTEDSLPVTVVEEEPAIVTNAEAPRSSEVTWNDSHEVVISDGVKARALDDTFQDGDQYKEIRKNFAEQFSKNLKSNMNIATSALFESGRVDIVRNPSTGASQVLLNGKEIAKGYIVPNQNSLKLIDAPGIKGGFFFNDTVYERAFKVAKEMAKTLSKNPSIIPTK